MDSIKKIITQPNDRGEIIIREGEAPPVDVPKKISITGDINTVGEYFKKRKETSDASLQAINKDRVVIYTDKKNRVITAHLDPESEKGVEIKGVLEFSDEIKPFFINQPKTFKKDEIVKLLRFNRLAFDSQEQYNAILLAYQSFTAKTATDMKQEADTRGNKANNFSKQVETNVPENFILNIPIFKGQTSERFRVEIAFDATDASVQFWFESTELNELIQVKTDVIFNEQLKGLQDYVIVNI